MQHKTKYLEELAISEITNKKLIFIEEVVSYLPCSRSSFYNHGLDKLDSIKEAILKNKVDLKASMRSKWYKSENATLQMGLYKLIGTKEERLRLTQTFQELSGKVDNGDAGIDWSKVSVETLVELNNASQKEDAKG